MRRSVLVSSLSLISIVLFLPGDFLVAQGPRAASTAKVNAPPGWEAVERLKHGTKVIVRQPLTPGEFEPWRPCRVVHVDSTALTCMPDGQKVQRVVYPIGQINSVYQLKLHIPWVRGVVYSGLGVLVGGVILTGENWNGSLAAVGAVIGGLNAVDSDPPKMQRVLVYQRVPDSTVADAIAVDELTGPDFRAK